MTGETTPADAATTDTPGEPRSRFYGRVSITVTLAAAIGLLILVSVGGVLGLGIWIARENTFSLLAANAHQGISAYAAELKHHLQPAEDQARFVAERIKAGEIDPADRERFAVLLSGALAAAPQIAAVLYLDPGLQAFGVGHGPDGRSLLVQTIDYSNDPAIKAAMTQAASRPSWGPPTWRQRFGETYLNRAHPILRGETFLGVVVSVVTVAQLSEFIAAPGTGTVGTRFILYGENEVLAHASLANGYDAGSDAAPLPALEGFADPVLAAIWNETERYDLVLDLPGESQGHVVRLDGQDYVYLYQYIVGLGPRPLIVGAYFKAADVSAEVERMIMALIAGVAALLVSLGAAVLVGRRIAQPIVRFSSAAARIRDLEIAKVEALPGSVFRELNDQAVAFNAMLRALRWFELYVPRKIVERLIKRGALAEAVSDAREVTVLFSDIAGFSTLSEGMTAPEVAAFVNHHFSLVAACIEAEDGTVDKFMGDAIMAFWGAPEHQPDAARRACRAALAIGGAIRADNAARAARGEAPVRVRLGIHSGSATVGNIGAPGRFNYTIIGDTVNIGERLERLGKELYPPDAEIAILISGDVVRRLGEGFVPAPIPAGRHRLKGRAGEVEVFRLEG